jgi:hypothetical protein
MSAPAGWYADPAGVGGERWWSGAEWSATTRPLAPVTNAYAAPGARTANVVGGYPSVTAGPPANVVGHPLAPAASSYHYLDVRSPYAAAYAGPAPGRSTTSKVLVAVAIGVGGFLVLGILAAIAIPTFLNQRAKSHSTAAAAQPVVVGAKAPATFAGLTPSITNGVPVTEAWGSTLDQWRQLYLQRGSQWAWAQVYGKGDRFVLVVADAPSAQLAGAIDLDLRGSGHRLYDAEVKGLTSPTAPLEVPTGVPGKMLCGTGMVDAVRIATCVWTDGREELIVVRSGGDELGLGTQVATALPLVHTSTVGP